MSFDPVTMRDILLYGFPQGYSSAYDAALSFYAVGFRGQDLVDALVDSGFSEREARQAVKKIEELEKKWARVASLDEIDIELIRFKLNAAVSEFLRNVFYWFYAGLKKLLHSWHVNLFGARLLKIFLGLGNSPFELGIDDQGRLVPLKPGGQMMTKMQLDMILQKNPDLSNGALRKGKDLFVIYDLDGAREKIVDILNQVGIKAVSITMTLGQWEGEGELSFSVEHLIGYKQWMKEFQEELERVLIPLILQRERGKTYNEIKERFSTYVIKYINDREIVETRKKLIDSLIENAIIRIKVLKEKIDKIMDYLCREFNQKTILFLIEHNFLGFLKRKMETHPCQKEG